MYLNFEPVEQRTTLCCLNNGSHPFKIKVSLRKQGWGFSDILPTEPNYSFDDVRVFFLVYFKLNL